MFKKMLIGSMAGAILAMSPLLRPLSHIPLNSPDMYVKRHRRMRSKDQQRPRKVRKLADPEFAAVVNQFTNWERNRWAGAGYPGLKGKDVQKVAEFLAALRRRDQRARAA